MIGSLVSDCVGGFTEGIVDGSLLDPNSGHGVTGLLCGFAALLLCRLETPPRSDNTQRPNTRSITGQTWIDFDGPLVDAASHALGFGKTLLTQPIGDSQTAAAVMAMDDDVVAALRFQFRQPILNLAHRQQLGLFDRNRLMLVRLAAVEEHKLVPSVQPSLYLSTGHFNGHSLRISHDDGRAFRDEVQNTDNERIVGRPRPIREQPSSNARNLVASVASFRESVMLSVPGYPAVRFSPKLCLKGDHHANHQPDANDSVGPDQRIVFRLRG